MKNNLTLTKFVVLFSLAVIFIIAFPDCNGNKNTIVGTYPDEIFDSGLSLREIDSIKNILK